MRAIRPASAAYPALAGPNGIEATSNDRIIRTARPGKTAQLMMDNINSAIAQAGFLQMRGFNQTRADEMRPSNLFSIELFAYTPTPEWGGQKLRIPLEDDGTVTARGVEWVYPVNPRITLVK